MLPVMYCKQLHQYLPALQSDLTVRGNIFLRKSGFM